MDTDSSSGSVTGLYITAAATTPVSEKTSVQVETGRGIVGDRYHAGAGTFSKPDVTGLQVTLVEQEEIDQFNAASGLDYAPGTLRRNIVTRGVRLNALVGKTFQVGEVTLRGVRLAEPCDHLAALTDRAVLDRMVHKSGLRADAVTGGTITVGDAVKVLGDA